MIRVFLVGALVGALLTYAEGLSVAASSSKPFDLGAATAAKLSKNGGAVPVELGGEKFEIPSAAKWSEDQINATKKQTPFEVIKEALGEADYDRLVEAAKKADPDNGLSFMMATALMEHYFEASGLGGPGE